MNTAAQQNLEDIKSKLEDIKSILSLGNLKTNIDDLTLEETIEALADSMLDEVECYID